MDVSPYTWPSMSKSAQKRQLLLGTVSNLAIRTLYLGSSIKYVNTFSVLFDTPLPHIINRQHFNTPSLKNTSAFANFSDLIFSLFRRISEFSFHECFNQFISRGSFGVFTNSYNTCTNILTSTKLQESTQISRRNFLTDMQIADYSQGETIFRWNSKQQ